ncbi:MAG: gliding motility lipoprotein GldH [Candidatus Amulumruptor caecigallinarius]|nr:gliding motility lipoprotein GldH [Candidatus Amulumruptor caecigallinarius]
MALPSCGDISSVAYSHFERIGSEGWDPADILIYEPWPADSAEASAHRYDIELVVRYSSRRRIKDLPLSIVREYENGRQEADTVVLRLFDSGGSPAGDGHYGVYELPSKVESGLRLCEGYSVSVTPLAERNESQGILSVGLLMLRR